MRNHLKTAAWLAGCACVALGSPVMAQDQEGAASEPNDVSDDSGTGADENVIIVTAQNREQNEQDVPIVMDVVGAEELQDAGFSDANDLSKVVPVAMIQQDQGTVQVTVRGVGNTAGGSQDNSVVTNIDGEYINTPEALGVSLFDLERVEVLRGPQGTLYGRNATGGAVNFITRKPGDTFAGNISASYGNYDSLRVDGGVDIPFGPGLGMRVAGFYEDRDGYVEHPGLPAGRYGGFVFPGYDAFRSDDNTAFGGRASFLADDLGGLSIYLAGEYSEREFTPQVYAAIDTHQPGFTPGAGCSGPGWEPTAPLITNQTLCIPASTNFLEDFDRSFYAAPANGGGRQFWNTHAVRGRIDYEFSPAATLSYIGGYRFFERERGSTLSLPVVYANLVDENNVQTQSHELRLAGDVGGIIYQVGGFLFKEDVESFGGFFLGNKLYDGPLTGFPPGPPAFLTTGMYINYNLRNSDTESWSAFGQVEVPLTDQLTAVGGLRYTHNSIVGLWRDKIGQFLGPAFRELNDTNFTPPLPGLESEQDKITWLAGLNFELDPDTLIYAKVSTGFKGGGFDAVGQFGPETNTAYEAGLKKNWGPSGQHIFNLAGFYYDYSGLQVDVLLSSAEGGRVFNAGAATVWGIEAETVIEVTDNGRFNLSVNYLNAELNELFALYNVYCVPVAEGGIGNCRRPSGDDYTSIGDLDENTPGIQSPNFGGNRPGYSPEWIIAAGYEHSFDLGSSGEIVFRANTTFKSSYFTNFLNYSDAKQESFTNTDLTLEYESPMGFSVAAFVRNLENKRQLTNAYFLAAGPDDIYNFQFGSPRLYGVRVGYEF